jgi:Family of unknown function (DUF6216)
MNTLALTPEIRNLFSVAAPIALWLSLMVCFAWVVWRIGSVHPIRQRVWRLVYGKAQIADPVIKAFVDERSDLMAFRFTAGLRGTRTIESARSLAAWLRANDEDASAVSLSGRYFDLENFRVRDERFPSDRKRAVIVIFATLTALLSLVPIILSAGNGALFRLTNSGTWFEAHPSAARVIAWPAWQRRPTLTVEACGGDQRAAAEATQFQVKDVGVVCKLISDPSAPQYLAASVTDQRIALAFVAGLLGLATCFILLPVIRVDAARQLAKRLK